MPQPNQNGPKCQGPQGSQILSLDKSELFKASELSHFYFSQTAVTTVSRIHQRGVEYWDKELILRFITWGSLYL